MAVDALAVSTEPVPQFAAPPGYCVPVRSSQLAADGEELAGPSKVSVQTCVQLGSGGVEVLGDGLLLVGGVVVVPPPPRATLNSHSE